MDLRKPDGRPLVLSGRAVALFSTRAASAAKIVMAPPAEKTVESR